jgi:RNA polymerase sporulation-specific sigma factor
MALNTAIGISGETDENKEIVYVKGLESYISYNPEELYLTKEQINGLKNYLEKNLSGFETVVFRCMVSGLTYKNIAKRLDKKVKSVDNAIQRIKRKSELWINQYKGD